MSSEAYIRGFRKAAESHGIDADKLAEVAAGPGMKKEAVNYGRLARLITKLSPRVKNPGFFTKTKPGKRFINPTKPMPENVRSVGRAVGEYAGESKPWNAADLPSSYGKDIHRLSPGKILAALGVAGGSGAAIAAKANSGYSSSASPASQAVGPTIPGNGKTNKPAGNDYWRTIREVIDNLSKAYDSLGPTERMLINMGLGAGGGALVGGMSGNAGKGALLGALAGGGLSYYNNAKRQADEAALLSEIDK